MKNMAIDGHLDEDITNLLLKKEILISYAKDNLNPEQIDINFD